MILLIFLIIALPLLIYFTINSFLDYTFDKKCSSGKNIVIYDAKNFSILRNYAKEEMPKDKYFLWANSVYKLKTIESKNVYGIIESSVTYSIKGDNIVTIKNYKIIVPNIFDSSGFGKVKRNCYFERNDEYPEYISFH